MSFTTFFAAVDINPIIGNQFKEAGILGLECDLSQVESIKGLVQTVIRHYGGLDILICNAGMFPKSLKIEEMDNELWNRSLEFNLSSHQQMI